MSAYKKEMKSAISNLKQKTKNSMLVNRMKRTLSQSMSAKKGEKSVIKEIPDMSAKKPQLKTYADRTRLTRSFTQELQNASKTRQSLNKTDTAIKHPKSPEKGPKTPQKVTFQGDTHVTLRRSPRFTMSLCVDPNNISEFSERSSCATFVASPEDNAENAPVISENTSHKSKVDKAKKPMKRNTKKSKKIVVEVEESGETRRSQRSRIKRGDMRPVYAFDTVKDFDGRDIAVSKIVGVEKYNDDLHSFRRRFYESMLKRKTISKGKKKGENGKAIRKRVDKIVEEKASDGVKTRRKRASLLPSVVKILSGGPTRERKKESICNEHFEMREEIELNNQRSDDYVANESSIELNENIREEYSVLLSRELESKDYQNVAKGVGVVVTETSTGVMRLSPSAMSEEYSHSSQVQFTIQKGHVKFLISGRELQLTIGDMIRVNDRTNYYVQNVSKSGDFAYLLFNFL